MDKFSIDIHYGGTFIKKKNLQYVGGDYEVVTNIDVDMVSLFEVVDMVVNVGAGIWKTLYYVEPQLELENGLRTVKSDNDVLQMIGALDHKRRIHIYVDHEGFDVFDQEEAINDDGPQVGEAEDQIHVGEAPVGEAGDQIHVDEAPIGEADEAPVGETWYPIHISIPLVSASLYDDNLSAVKSDDTMHEANTAESVNNSLEICLHDRFSSLAEIKKKIVNYALIKGRDIKFTKHEKGRVEARCQKDCAWKLYASKVTNEESFQVKTLNNVHNCDRKMAIRHATAKWVAERYLQRFRSQPKWKISSIIDTVRQDWNININPSLAIRARRRAVNVGSTVQYKQLGSRKKRTSDVDEPKSQSKSDKMRKVIKCSKCRGLNHNARTCKRVTIDSSMEASASTT